MPDHRPTGERTPAQRQADHASLGRLSESLVPALVQKLATSGLGELEVREGDWRIRLRRAAPAAARDASAPSGRAWAPIPNATGADATRPPRRLPRPPPQGPADPGDHAPASPGRTMALSPAVGVFHPEAAVGKHVRAGDRIAFVDLLGIAQDVIVADRRDARRGLPPGRRGGRVRRGGRRRRVRRHRRVRAHAGRRVRPRHRPPGETVVADDEPPDEPPARTRHRTPTRRPAHDQPRPHRQPRRDRAAHPPRVPDARRSRPSSPTPRPIAARCRRCSPTRPSASGRPTRAARTSRRPR